MDKTSFRPIEYKMTAEMARDILATWKGPKTNPQDMLCRYVNEEFNLRGNCVNVLIHDGND